MCMSYSRPMAVSIWFKSYDIVPDQTPSRRGNVFKSKRVTMPKLFEPPLSAHHRSVFSVALALTTLPPPMTTSKLATSELEKPRLPRKGPNPSGAEDQYTKSQDEKGTERREWRYEK